MLVTTDTAPLVAAAIDTHRDTFLVGVYNADGKEPAVTAISDFGCVIDALEGVEEIICVEVGELLYKQGLPLVSGLDDIRTAALLTDTGVLLGQADWELLTIA